jgi:ketosteroid isomerase-like protein
MPWTCSQNVAVGVRALFLLLALNSLFSQENDKERMVDSLRRNVVRIEAQEDGFGFIVGERGGLLYVVTARHVVVGRDDVPATAPAKVRVEFYDRRGKMYDADILGTHDVARDLAVLTVPAPSGVEWIRECLAGTEKQKGGTSVWFVGRDREWKPSVSPGRLLAGPSLDGLLDIDGMPVKPGSSGGPAIAESGIIGMIETDSAEETRALSADFIRKAFEGWNHPWDLRVFQGGGGGSGLAAIQDLLRRYADAYNRRDSNALWKVWPDAAQSTRHTIEESFRNARSITMSIQPEEPEIQSDGKTAIVRGQYSQEFTGRNGSQQKSKGKISFHLSKKNGTWIMASVD